MSMIATAEDARRRARRHLPRLIFDYFDGAAGRETTARRNEDALSDVRLTPRIFRDVVKRDLTTTFLGKTFNAPIGVSPMGMCGLARSGADEMLAAAATARNIPIAVSTAASITLERMAEATSGAAWFQLYANPSRELTADLLTRAKAAGYDTLVFTADVPEVAARPRDVKNGFKMPFRIGPKQFIDFALHPFWSIPMLLKGAPRPENFYVGGNDGFDRHGSRAWADWEYFKGLRDEWPGKIIVKGVLSPEDAVEAQQIGADALWVSNHGGRQMDAAPASIEALPIVRAAVGPDIPLIMDSGVRSGEDVLRALSLGADMAFIGRPLLYAIAAEGKGGLASYLDTVISDFDIAMAQFGVTKTEEIRI